MKNLLYWILAVLITLTAVVYQRVTGPTNAKKVNFSINDRKYKAKFPRSLETLVTLEEAKAGVKFNKVSKAEFKIDSLPVGTLLSVKYRRYPGNDSLQSAQIIFTDGRYTFDLPSQPPAGKIIYYPVIFYNGEELILERDSGIIVRFKSPVPSLVLIPHVLLMFFAMLLANYSGITALLSYKKSLKYSFYVIITLGIGGLIFGPIVQKYAFGAYWTGWPMGEDLTDNKTLIAFLFWVVAYLLNRKDKVRGYLLLIAAIVTLMIYSIPHSTAGSEYDYNKGAVVTGK